MMDWGISVVRKNWWNHNVARFKVTPPSLLGVTAAVGLYLLFIEDKGVSIHFSLMTAPFASLLVFHVRITIDTSMVGTWKAMIDSSMVETWKAMPMSFPINKVIALVSALMTLVEEGMMLSEAAW